MSTPGTLVYSPEIRVHIQTSTGTIYDVSDDITVANVGRIINGVSSAQISLQNAGRKYDDVFSEMDKVAVYLTRLRRLLVFTGYLDGVPVMSAFPGTVVIRASCTLKRLQYWAWDPTTDASHQLLDTNPSNVQNFDMTDGGLAKKTIDVLTQVCGWPKAQIHIGAIPEGWFNAISGVARKLISESTQLDLIAKVGSAGYMNGQNTLEKGTQIIDGVGAGTGQIPDYTGLMTTYTAAADQLDARADRPPSNPWYITMSWPYLTYNANKGTLSPTSGVDVASARKWWMGRKILAVNPKTGKGVCLQACGWGPKQINADNIAVAATSQEAANVLGVKKPSLATAADPRIESNINFAFAPAGMALGEQKQVVDPTQANGLSRDLKNANAGSAVSFADTAAQWALSSGIDYGWGSGHPANGTDAHPSKLDCSGLVNWALARTGKPQLGDSRTQAAAVTPITLEEAKKTKGSLVFLSSDGSPTGVHHVGISMGDGTTAEARDVGGNIGVYAWGSGNNWNFAGKIKSLNYTGAVGTGTGGTPGKANGGAIGGNVDSGSDTSAGGQSLDGQIADALFNVWQWIGNTDYGGDLLSGARALMNDVPVMQTINELMTTGLRQYCSAPNGDFIGWFPDYFGWWGTAGKMIIRPIEIQQNFAVARSDDNLKTHWFVTSSTTGVEGAGDASSIAQMYATAGIASVEMPELMKALFRVGNEFDDNGKAFLARFGARPQYEAIDTISGHLQEFFFSVFRFMLNWASRWSATVNLTFMPELFPGMLACFPEYGVQAYVQEVNHSVDLRANAGFATQAQLIAWSSIGQSSQIKGLPVGSSL